MSRANLKTFGSNALKIVKSEVDYSFSLDENLLKNTLENEKIKNREVVLISVAGAFRKGKSFILGFFLRYLYAKYEHLSMVNDDAWLGNDDEPLLGFDWRGGSDRDTIGILIWEKIFLHTTLDGRKLAIIVMDTQGVFDSKSTAKEGATIFALSAMLSSVLIYNVSEMIRENDLSNLQFFAEYGRLAMQESGIKPFQKLLFLVRDWSSPHELPFGSEGGLLHLNKRLEINDDQAPEQKSVRKGLNDLFTDLQCFLLPHPGLTVSTNPNFKGKLSDIEEAFKKQLLVLVPMLLAPNNLIVKEVGGQTVTCKSLIHYFKFCLKAFSQEGDLPDPRSILNLNAEANNLAAVDSANRQYQIEMADIAACGYMNPMVLTEKHNRIVARCTLHFDQQPKLGGKMISDVYKAQLEFDLNSKLKIVLSQNAAKNFFMRLKVPATFFLIWALCLLYLNSIGYILCWTNLGTLNLPISIILWIMVALFVIWLVLLYCSHKYSKVIYAISLDALDRIVEPVFDGVIIPAFYTGIASIRIETTSILSSVLIFVMNAIKSQ